MNVPGVAEGNWSWQATKADLAAGEEFLGGLTRSTNREVK